MRKRTRLDRLLLLALSLLSGCAAGGVSADAFSSSPSGGFGAYLMGRYAEDSNDFNRGADDLLAALAQNPDDHLLMEQAFLACVLAGRPEATMLARQLKDSPIAQLVLGDQAARQGDWQTARGYFASVQSKGLADYLSPLLVAWSQAGAQDTDAALSTLAPQLKGPLGALYALNSALIADLGDRFPQAQQFYDQAQAAFGGTNLRLGRILANWDVRQNRPDDATEVLRALGRNAPALQLVVPALIADERARPVRTATDGLAEVYLSFAAQLREENHADVALALLRLALDLRPDLTAARLLMTDALIDSKNDAEAAMLLAPISSSDPLIPLVRLREAELDAAQGEAGAAEDILRKLANDLPTATSPLVALADMQRIQNDTTGAIATLGEAISRAPAGEAADWSLYFTRAATEQQAGDWPAAEGDLRHALALSPDQPEVLNFLGYAWADKGEHLTQARAMLDRAVSLRPDDGAIIDSLGWVELRQGDVSGAVKLLQKAVQIEPGDSEINGHLGDAYWAAGLKLQARYQWQLALNLKPDAAAVPKLEAKLHDAERATETVSK